MAIPLPATAATSNQATAALHLTRPPLSPVCLHIRWAPPSFIDPSTPPPAGLVCGRLWDAQSLCQRSHHRLSRQQPQARTQVCASSLTQTILFSSWKHLQNFWLTASQKVAARLRRLCPTPLLIFAVILTCKWNQRILCDWTESNQTRQPSWFPRRESSEDPTQFCAPCASA